jgi:hypothetical protein
MSVSFTKIIPAFLITCAVASVAFVGGAALFLWVLERNFYPLGGGPPLTTSDTIFLLVSVLLILASFILFPASAYINRKKIAAATFSNLVFGIWGTFPVIVVAFTLICIAGFYKASALDFQSFRNKVAASNTEIVLKGPLTVTSGRDQNFIQLDLGLVDLPTNVHSCRLDLGLVNEDNIPGKITNFRIAHVEGTRKNKTWRFTQTIDGQELDSGDADQFTVRVQPIAVERIPPEYLHGVKVRVSTQYIDQEVIIANQYFPMEFRVK